MAGEQLTFLPFGESSGARREKERERKRRWRAQHPDRHRASDARWKAKDPERAAAIARANAKRWRERNPEKARESHRRSNKRRYIPGGKSGIRRPHLTDGEKAEIRAFYSAGLTFKEIGQRIHRAGGTVSSYLRSSESIPRPLRPGPRAGAWKGGRVLSHGYVYVWLSPDDPMACMRDKGGRVAEHRLVLARKLGRPLLLSETVHHINGVPTDNAPENLQLRQGRHGKHIAFVCLDCGSHRIGPTKILDASDAEDSCRS
jgi:HNH endonuclease